MRFTVVLVAIVMALVWALVPAAQAVLATTKLSGYADLPNPTANLKVVPQGSLVIPMDLKQYTTGGVFNVRAYGLAFYLLHANIPIYWTIAKGKAKDGVDFTASAHQYWAKNSSSGAMSSVSFSGGPLVVHKSYVASALSVITANSYTDVVLYVLDANTTIDVRHTLLTRPKVLLSNLSGYGSTIVNPLVAAGLVEGTHYAVASASQASSVISSLNATTCYSTFVEPHYIFSSDAPVYFSAVQSYVESGGNFYAQCASTRSYENTSGGFMTTKGIQQYGTANTNLLYPLPDLPFTQMIGDIDGTNDGVITDFYLLSSGAWRANAYSHVVNNPTAVTYNGNVTISGSTKLTTDLSGGMIFYMGGHEWSSASAALANGRRMYFNALLTPANRPASCGFDFCPTGETCTAGACQYCVCVNNTKFITNATCCTNGPHAEPDAYAKSDAHSKPDANAEPDTHAEPDADFKPFVVVDAHAHAKPDSHTEPIVVVDAHSDSKPNAHAKSDAHCEPDANAEPDADFKPFVVFDAHAHAKPDSHTKPIVVINAHYDSKPDAHAKPDIHSEPIVIFHSHAHAESVVVLDAYAKPDANANHIVVVDAHAEPDIHSEPFIVFNSHAESVVVLYAHAKPYAHSESIVVIDSLSEPDIHSEPIVVLDAHAKPDTYTEPIVVFYAHAEPDTHAEPIVVVHAHAEPDIHAEPIVVLYAHAFSYAKPIVVIDAHTYAKPDSHTEPIVVIDAHTDSKPDAHAEPILVFHTHAHAKPDSHTEPIVVFHTHAHFKPDSNTEPIVVAYAHTVSKPDTEPIGVFHADSLADELGFPTEHALDQPNRAAAGVAIGAIAGGGAAVGAASAAIGAAYVLYRRMNRAEASAELPTGNAMFVDQTAQVNSLFTDSQTEFHNEIYTV